ncbi:vicilin-like seed storage protein At2g18540 [Anabas testudineus]|uniref:vicilin-like seed storage protein At2g18540 n=1 Tax=Anabas testudineus TaxID=64144 RepID=UPI00143DB958|nr:vicilin-like seed storage protein At2g18540 [Anabas testudineus]
MSEQDKDKKLDQKKQQENQTEHMQPETERQKVENNKKFLHEMKERREREKEEKELYLKDRKKEERTTGPDDKREKDCEENQRDFTVMNQNQENNERLKQTEEEKKFHLDRRGVEEQKHRPEIKPQNRDQHVLEIKKQEESKTERNKDKREKDQKMKEKNHQSETEKKFPSVNGDDTERTEVKIQQIIQELQKQPEEKDQRRLEEVRLQEDGFGKVESQEGAKGNTMKTNKTQRKEKKVKERQPRQEGLMETEQEPERKPLVTQVETTERQWKNLKRTRVKLQKDQQEMCENDEGQRDVKRRLNHQDLELDVCQQQSDGMNHIYRKPEQQDEDLMEFESEDNMETDFTADSQQSRRFIQDQSPMCQEEQEDVVMDVQPEAQTLGSRSS